VRRLSYLLILVGLATLATIPLGIIRSDRHAAAAQAHLAQQFRADTACQDTLVPQSRCTSKTQRPQTTTMPPTTTMTVRPVAKPSIDRSGPLALPAAVSPLLPGGVLDRLVIPTIGLSRYVVQGTAETDLAQGPGHYLGTPLPGQYGNVAIAGHRTTYGAPFWALNELTPGDRIFLTDTTGRTWTYKVTGHLVVSPGQLSVIGPLKGYYLTLTTCNPRFWATGRLVVRAELLRPSPKGDL
jgi:LPXTG-site transpeptidase (sortase) family protein